MVVNNKIRFCSGAFFIASFLFFPSYIQALETEETAPLITPPLNNQAAAEEREAEAAAARIIQRLIRRAQVSPVATEEVSAPAAEPATPAAEVEEAELEGQNSNSGQQRFMEGFDPITPELLEQIPQEDLEEFPEPNAEDMVYMAPELLEWVVQKRKNPGAAEARMNERAAQIQYPETETRIPDEAFFAVGEELSRRCQE
jgi:hypothetical protein